MELRGQLWFALEKVCRDFRDFSGLEEQKALELVILLLGNLLAEQKADLEKLIAQQKPRPQEQPE